jgi:hypothetical protein
MANLFENIIELSKWPNNIKTFFFSHQVYVFYIGRDWIALFIKEGLVL